MFSFTFRLDNIWPSKLAVSCLQKLVSQPDSMSNGYRSYNTWDSKEPNFVQVLLKGELNGFQNIKWQYLTFPFSISNMQDKLGCQHRQLFWCTESSTDIYIEQVKQELISERWFLGRISAFISIEIFVCWLLYFHSPWFLSPALDHFSSLTYLSKLQNIYLF